MTPKLLVALICHAGAEDPWEKVEWGRKLQHYPTVEEFVAFPGKLSVPVLVDLHCSCDNSA